MVKPQSPTPPTGEESTPQGPRGSFPDGVMWDEWDGLLPEENVTVLSVEDQPCMGGQLRKFRMSDRTTRTVIFFKGSVDIYHIVFVCWGVLCVLYCVVFLLRIVRNVCGLRCGSFSRRVDHQGFIGVGGYGTGIHAPDIRERVGAKEGKVASLVNRVNFFWLLFALLYMFNC